MKSLGIILLVILLLSGLASASILEAEEGELVKLNITATDPDGDLLDITFSYPFDENGSWQTEIGDEGEYITTIKVNDPNGEEISQNVSIIIKRKKIAPPEANGSYSVKENELLKIDLPEKNIKNLPVTYYADLPEGARLVNNSIYWTPSYDTVKAEPSYFDLLFHKWKITSKFSLAQKKSYDIRVVGISDEKSTESHIDVDVINSNRAPFFEEVPDKLTVAEGEKLKIPYRANDYDIDKLFVFFSGMVDQNNQLIDFEKAGDHIVDITLSDGEEKVSHAINIEVINTNRKPEVKTYPIIISEGEDKKIKLYGNDLDGDEIDYTIIEGPEFAKLENNTLVLYPDFNAVENDDKNNFNIIIGLSDGESEVVENMSITVLNKNRAPVIESGFPDEKFVVKRGQVFSFKVEAYDPDGDSLTYTWKGGLFDKTQGESTHNRKFLKSGVRKFSVEVSDGKYTVEKRWKILVR